MDARRVVGSGGWSRPKVVSTVLALVSAGMTLVAGEPVPGLVTDRFVRLADTGTGYAGLELGSGRSDWSNEPFDVEPFNVEPFNVEPFDVEPFDVEPTAPFGWPLSPVPKIGQPFQPPTRPYGRGHRGADLVGVPGQPVLAAGAGTVVYAAPLADRGVVSVDHADGLRTTYEPVHALVRPGQRIRRGEVLGTLEAGHRRCPGPACLHWGLRRDRAYLDPLLLVRRARVRLLPWVSEPSPGWAGAPTGWAEPTG